MSRRPKIAVSIGDLNGIGIEIALRAHATIKEWCHPVYFVSYEMCRRAAEILHLDIPEDFDHSAPDAAPFSILPGRTDAHAGRYGFLSFKKAVEAVRNQEADAVVTLPVNKEAWMLAGIGYKGHTDALRDFFKQDAIMMLGCEKMWVALFTAHIALKEVPRHIEKKRLTRFLLDFQKETGAEKIGVLGLNPHAGDHGVLGVEEETIAAAIAAANARLSGEGSRCSPFEGPLVPDVAFTPKMRENFHFYVAMYHDQGLAPLKALYFDESVNVSLNLPIVRTSVDHGTAFDIAYLPDRPLNLKSYFQAVRTAVAMSQKRDQRS
ncbi:4-hydroxythreonine-4-phosphate dehydrogenase [Hydrogenimonas urashimensis]|uniref:4-hydroxythreonine-4-phosphate dehydrogenase n=1 Tax=Hydrogenimonas urashimensis TaxID=2740515 RepID=UPI0019160F48|nr:4-hydroxythreonine-4-phosphate dehydrogenase [Hydrogenimonas urashimensis]